MPQFFRPHPQRYLKEDDDTGSEIVSCATSVSGGSLHYSCSTAPPLGGRPASMYSSASTRNDQQLQFQSGGSTNSTRNHQAALVTTTIFTGNAPLTTRKGISTIRGVAACGRWKNDKEVHACELCTLPFSFTTPSSALKNPSPAQRLKLRLGALVRRKHHCRQCGGIFCSKCSGEFIPIPAFGYTTDAEQRVCLPCFGFLCNQLVTGGPACANAQANLRIMAQGKSSSVGGRTSNNNNMPAISRTSSAASGYYTNALGRDSQSTLGCPGETDVRWAISNNINNLSYQQHSSGTNNQQRHSVTFNSPSTANSSMVGSTYYGNHFHQQVAVVHHPSGSSGNGSFASHPSHGSPVVGHQAPNSVPPPPHFQLHQPIGNTQHQQHLFLPGAERAPLCSSGMEEDEEYEGSYSDSSYEEEEETSSSATTPGSRGGHPLSGGARPPHQPAFRQGNAPSTLPPTQQQQYDDENFCGNNQYNGAAAETRNILQEAIIRSRRADEDEFVPFVSTYQPPPQQQQQYYGTSETYYDDDEEGDWEEDDEEGDDDYYDDEEGSTSSSSDLMAPPIPTHELLMAIQHRSECVSTNASFALPTRVDGDIDFDDDEDCNTSRHSQQQHIQSQSSGNFYAQLSPASTGVAGVIQHHHSRSTSPGKGRNASGLFSYRLPGSTDPTYSPEQSGETPQHRPKSMVLTADYVRVLQAGTIRVPSSRRCSNQGGISPMMSANGSTSPHGRSLSARLSPNGTRSRKNSSYPTKAVESCSDSDDSSGFGTPLMVMPPVADSRPQQFNGAPSFLRAPGDAHPPTIPDPLQPPATSMMNSSSNVITVLLYPSAGREQALVCTVSPTETLFDLAQRIAENYYKLIFSPFRPRPTEDELEQTVHRHMRFLVTPALHAIPVDGKEARALPVSDVIALHDRVVLTASPIGDADEGGFSPCEIVALRDFVDAAASHPVLPTDASDKQHIKPPRRIGGAIQKETGILGSSFASPGAFYDGSSL